MTDNRYDRFPDKPDLRNSLNAYQVSRDALLAEISQAIATDGRFVAAWLTGSFGRDEADAVSDLDLTLVVADAHSESLCARVEQVSAQTTKERLALFSQFGQPAVLHENNHNAPDGGTFTYVLYADSAVAVDWTLLPQKQALRPTQARILFDQVGISPAAPAEPESVAQRISQADEIVAFFWMMTAVTAKYLVRGDLVFGQCQLESLHGMVQEVERLLAGKPWQYRRGSLSQFEPTIATQKQAVYRLCADMLSLTPRLVESGGSVRPSPLPTIQMLLNLVRDES
jgi:predicted nucleotidyltransferase